MHKMVKQNQLSFEHSFGLLFHLTLEMPPEENVNAPPPFCVDFLDHLIKFHPECNYHPYMLNQCMDGN